MDLITVSEHVKNSPIEGVVAPGFELVAEMFVRNFEQGLEIGSAVAAYRCDQLLFDL